MLAPGFMNSVYALSLVPRHPPLSAAPCLVTQLFIFKMADGNKGNRAAARADQISQRVDWGEASISGTTALLIEALVLSTGDL